MTTLEDAPVQHAAVHRESLPRSILVHVEGGPDAAGRLRLAVDLARRFDATLIGLGAEMIQTLSDPSGMLGGEWVVQLQSLVEDNLRRAEETFRAATAGMDTDWTAIEAFPARAMARHARSADLIVAGGAPLGGEGAYRAAHPAELVMQCARPVLVAPPKPGRFHGRAVIVAWKDTREARRALTDSLPFLKAAEQVVVVECCARDEVVAAGHNTSDVVQQLRRHGVEASGKAIPAAPERVATELQIAAQEIGADLIVAGAYGHTRLGEWAFGGVTYDLLNTPERFILLSH
ncbi:universal stress protein [Phenylobacterium sp.]|uniref:universal stress protein n=1 Tax=Phenylobacterium sp. TaxID=1871053 RepID=UPI00286BE71C|nr:universal stress protein [Phenylobacterium sp.]